MLCSGLQLLLEKLEKQEKLKKLEKDLFIHFVLEKLEKLSMLLLGAIIGYLFDIIIGLNTGKIFPGVKKFILQNIKIWKWPKQWKVCNYILYFSLFKSFAKLVNFELFLWNSVALLTFSILFSYSVFTKIKVFSLM